MKLFLLSFVLIYGGMQAVLYIRVASVLSRSWALQAGVVSWLILMVAAPVATHVLDQARVTWAAKGMAWIGYSWMGLSFIAFCLSLVSYAIFGLWLLVARWGPWPLPLLSSRTQALVVVGLSIILVLWAVGAHHSLQVQRIDWPTSKLEPGDRPLRLVLISDLHLGLMAEDRTAREIVSRIRAEKPDLILCTGDMVDSNIFGLESTARLFQELSPRLGKFAVTGNHETYVGLDRAAAFLDQAGFTLVRNARIDVGDNISLVGLDYDRSSTCALEADLMSQLSPDRITFLLKHAPNVCARSASRVDWQLSGHTHKGQIFPFGLVVQRVYPYLAGMYFLPEGASLYVSQGTGSWGPKMRLGTQREMTVIRLIPAEGKGRNSGESDGRKAG